VLLIFFLYCLLLSVPVLYLVSLSVNISYGTGSADSSFGVMVPYSTWTFLWPVKKIRCQIEIGTGSVS
jgi:hypothetical protein